MNKLDQKRPGGYTRKFSPSAIIIWQRTEIISWIINDLSRSN